MNQFIQPKGSFAEACKTGNIDVAKLLLQLKPNINVSAKNEEAFRYACRNGHLHVAQWLLQLKPDINISVFLVFCLSQIAQLFFCCQ